MKRVLLIRHGESQHNAEGDCLSGVSNTPITDRGRAQATALKAVLERLSVDTVYASPLERAMETARLAVPRLADSVRIAPCLQEFDYGDYEGVPLARLSDTDAIIRQWNQAPGGMSFPNGGCISGHAERVFRGLTDLVASSPGGVLACFSHRTTIRLFFAEALGLPLDYFRRIPCANASISEFSYQLDKVSVESLNLTLADISAREGEE